VVQNTAQRLQIRGLNDLHDPFQIVHQPSPGFLKAASPEADTEKRAAKESRGRFPQSHLDVVPPVGAAAEIGGPRHYRVFPEGAVEVLHLNEMYHARTRAPIQASR
jgi:hypothetical protein